MEPLPDLASLSDDELKELIDDLTREEQEVSYRRRILHGKIDILRAELVVAAPEVGRQERARARRRRRAHRHSHGQGHAAGVDGQPVLPGVRVPEPGDRQLLLEVRLAARPGGGRARRRWRSRPSRPTRNGRPTLEDFGIKGPALVVRSGGGRAGETFVLDERADDDRPLAGLRHLPRRRHGLAQARRRRARRATRLEIEDLGSLNGTFLNRQADRVAGRARGRRRAADRQVPAHLPPMSDRARTPSASGCSRSARSASG